MTRATGTTDTTDTADATDTARPAGGTAPAATLLRLADAHVVYPARGGRLFRPDRVYALTGADLAVRAGETVGVVGESGCGKSTLARVLVGLERPTRGTVSYRDRDLWALPFAERRAVIGRHLGMIFQDPSTALNRRLPVRRVLRDPLDVHRQGTPEQREERVRELMSLVGLPAQLADALPGQLSGGQRQRVAIARALALEPELVVADEPTSALDVSVRAQILNLLLDLRDRLGLAMVFISHDIQTVRRMSDRVITMYLGRIVEESPAAEVTGHARHPYTRALFSATPGLLDPIDPIPLVGPVPSATRPPSGCPFRTRCWKADDACAASMPDFSVNGAATAPDADANAAADTNADADTDTDTDADTDADTDTDTDADTGSGPDAHGAHRYRCHHPVGGDETTHELVLQARRDTPNAPNPPQTPPTATMEKHPPTTA